MATFAQCLPISFIPKQFLVSPVWNNVINNRGNVVFIICHALPAPFGLR
jgi:hypothetical protein